MLRLAMLNKPRILLHLEGATIFILTIFFYRMIHASWILYGILILSPDLFMLGYLVNARIGSAAYNFVHTTTLPLLAVALAFTFQQQQLLPYALIWLSHIGMDRMLGYGLKYPTQFKDTHLQHV
jgi:hypothetical protein